VATEAGFEPALQCSLESVLDTEPAASAVYSVAATSASPSPIDENLPTIRLDLSIEILFCRRHITSNLLPSSMSKYDADPSVF